MPRQYEHIRDAYLKKGKSEKEAKKLAAMTYNANHPGHPMKPGTHGHMASGGSVKKRKGPSLPPQLAAAAAGAPPPAGAPMAGGNAPGLPGMKRGGHTKHHAHGGVTKYGESTHSRGGGIARRGFAGGGVTRGDGVAQRGHTRGTCR